MENESRFLPVNRLSTSVKISLPVCQSNTPTPVDVKISLPVRQSHTPTPVDRAEGTGVGRTVTGSTKEPSTLYSETSDREEMTPWNRRTEGERHGVNREDILPLVSSIINIVEEVS